MRKLLALVVFWIAIVHLSCSMEEDNVNKNNKISFHKNLKTSQVKNSQRQRKHRSKQNNKNKGRKARKKHQRKRNVNRTYRKNEARNKQGKKKSKTSKRRMRNRKNRGKKTKNMERKQKRSRKKNILKQSSECEAGCSDILSSMMKLQRKQNTFVKQFNRIVRGQAQARKKGLKKANFDSSTDDGPLNLLIAAGGGNKSELSCAGSKTNQAAIMMKNLTTKLENCKSNIGSKCNITSQFVTIKSEWKACNESMVSFKTAMDECLKKSGKAVCDCFNGSAVLALKTKLDACDMKEMAAAASKDLTAKKACVSGYGGCRSLGEKIRKVLAICHVGGPTEKDLKEKVGKLLKNKKANEAILAKTKALASGTRKMTKRASITFNGITVNIDTCSMWADAALMWLTHLDGDVIADISGVGEDIAAITPECTAADKAKLMAVQAKGEAVAKKVEKNWEMVQKILEKATGSTISSEAAEALVGTTAAAAAVTKSVNRRHRIMEHIKQRQ